MVFIGLILLAVAAVVAVDLIVQNTNDVVIHAFGQTWTVAEYWVLIAGLILSALAILGFALMVISARSGRRARVERRVLARENERLIDSRPTVDERPSASAVAASAPTTSEARPAATEVPPAAPDVRTEPAAVRSDSTHVDPPVRQDAPRQDIPTTSGSQDPRQP